MPLIRICEVCGHARARGPRWIGLGGEPLCFLCGDTAMGSQIKKIQRRGRPKPTVKQMVDYSVEVSALCMRHEAELEKLQEMLHKLEKRTIFWRRLCFALSSIVFLSACLWAWLK